jgi:predicted dehydrogenase
VSRKSRQKFPNIALATEIDEALGSGEVDAAVVCTEAAAHYAIAFRCLEKGIPVLVEKPMTTTVHDAETRVDLAHARKRRLW